MIVNGRPFQAPMNDSIVAVAVPFSGSTRSPDASTVARSCPSRWCRRPAVQAASAMSRFSARTVSFVAQGLASATIASAFVLKRSAVALIAAFAVLGDGVDDAADWRDLGRFAVRLSSPEASVKTAFRSRVFRASRRRCLLANQSLPMPLATSCTSPRIVWPSSSCRPRRRSPPT